MRRLLLFIVVAVLALGFTACNTTSTNGPALKPLGEAGLSMTKTATGTFTPDWTLTKNAYDAGGNTVSSATIAPGQQGTFHYKVVATMSDSGGTFGVKGDVKLTNGLVKDLTVSSITDTLPVGGTDVTIPLDCTPSPSTVLASGATVTCTYDYAFSTVTPPLNTTLTNTANAKVSYQATTAGVTSTVTATPSASATFSFDPTTAPAPTIEDTVTNCPSGFTCTKQNKTTTTSTDGKTVTLAYDLIVKNNNDSTQCGKHYTLSNLAGIANTSTQATKDIDVYSGDCGSTPPPPSKTCTLTQGYWKTHSSYGPATPEDPTWTAGLTFDGVQVGGPDAPFFISGSTWYELFQISPRGSAYIQLAHQYMAAMLNLAAGAPEPLDVSSSLSGITAWLSSNTPDSYSGGKQAKSWASMLDNYNNGYDGVPHCGS